MGNHFLFFAITLFSGRKQNTGFTKNEKKKGKTIQQKTTQLK